MNTTTATYHNAEASTESRGRSVFAAAFILLILVAAALAGWAPLGFALVTVFLFAGPHNWMEARFFLSRMPARWGAQKHYFLLGAGGILTLAVGSVLWPTFARSWQWETDSVLLGLAVWNSAFLLWIVALAVLRFRETRREAWLWTVPAGCLLLAANWLQPLAWSLGLVYLHPLVALWFLDRELKRRQHDWHRVYRRILWLLPVVVGGLYWQLHNAPHLPGRDWLTMQVTGQAGAGVLSEVSSRFLVATHAFLELLHYAAWIVLIPLVGYAGSPWRLQKIPLAQRSRVWRKAVLWILCAGAAVVVALWAGFLVNYPVTRDVYFTVAILHVLAEIPFLLRML